MNVEIWTNFFFNSFHFWSKKKTEKKTCICIIAISWVSYFRRAIRIAVLKYNREITLPIRSATFYWWVYPLCSTKSRCPEDKFACANTVCIDLELVCDQENDCGDGSDEAMSICHQRLGQSLNARPKCDKVERKSFKGQKRSKVYEFRHKAPYTSVSSFIWFKS